MNRFGSRFISKVRKLRKSRRDAPSVSVSHIASTVGIESVPVSEGLSYDAPCCFAVTGAGSCGAKVPVTNQSSTDETTGDSAGSGPPISSAVHKSKYHQQRFVTLGESIKTFPGIRHHCLFDEANPVVAYFSEATLYPIPEDGSGLCYAKYTTVYQYGEPDAWSINENDEGSPHQCRSLVVYNGIEIK